MTKLLELKEQLIRFYGKYETYLYPVVKFAIALALFGIINANVGFMERVSTLSAALVLALLCAILPVSAILWFGAALVLADMYALSVEVAATTLVLFAILFFLYFRFAPKDGLAAVLTPVCFRLNIPYLMPIGMSLLRSASSVISVVCGTVVYYYLDGIRQNAGTLVNASDEDTEFSRFDICVGQFLGNKEMYLVIAVFVVTALMVYLVRRMEVDNAWTIAIVSGTLINLAGLFVGYLVLGITGKTVGLLVGNGVSLLLAFVLQFFFMNLDYARTERVQFEDDEYYYYVKAVPKKMVAARDVKVKHFGNTASMGKRIDRSPQPAREEETGGRAGAKEPDIDEDLDFLK